MRMDDFVLKIAASLIRGRRKGIAAGIFDQEDYLGYDEALIRANDVAHALKPLFQPD